MIENNLNFSVIVENPKNFTFHQYYTSNKKLLLTSVFPNTQKSRKATQNPSNQQAIHPSYSKMMQKRTQRKYHLTTCVHSKLIILNFHCNPIIFCRLFQFFNFFLAILLHANFSLSLSLFGSGFLFLCFFGSRNWTNVKESDVSWLFKYFSLFFILFASVSCQL